MVACEVIRVFMCAGSEEKGRNARSQVLLAEVCFRGLVVDEYILREGIF